MFKWVMIFLGVLFVLVLAIPLFLAPSYHVERSITVPYPDSTVFEMVAHLDNWLKWNPWTELDPNASNRFTGTSGEVGSAWHWEGEEMGAGSFTMLTIEENRRLYFQIEFTSPWSSEADDNWTFTPTADGGTTIVWSNSGRYPYLVRYLGSMIEEAYETSFETGLNNIERTLALEATQNNPATLEPNVAH